MTVFLGGMLVSVIALIRRRDEFAKVFGFDPPHRTDTELAFVVVQRDVDQTLKTLAKSSESRRKAAQQAAFEFNDLMGAPHWKDKSPQDRLEAVRLRNRSVIRSTREAEEIRKEFDRALFLAKKFGFDVRPGFEDYLVGRTIHYKEID